MGGLPDIETEIKIIEKYDSACRLLNRLRNSVEQLSNDALAARNSILDKYRRAGVKHSECDHPVAAYYPHDNSDRCWYCDFILRGG